MRVLLAFIGDGATGSCSIGFAVGMLRLQMALLATKGIQATVQILPSVKAAAEAARDGGFQAVVAIEEHIAFPVPFVTRALAAKWPFVAGVYPLPRLDWDRVIARAAEPVESMRFKGNVYNVDPASARPSGETGYLAVREAGLGAVVLKKEAIEALAACDASTDQGLCKAWGKDILADLDQPCATMGPLEFTGCVGMRAMATQT